MSITLSIRKSLLCGSIGAIVLAGGCTPKETVYVRTPAPVADQPAADEATRIRAYPKSYALYPSGATEAWPTRFYYHSNENLDPASNIVADSFMFLIQTGSLPVTVAMEPPFQTSVVYGSDVLIPSYTAMPPVPPETLPLTGRPDPDPLAAPQRPVAPALPPILPDEPPTIAPPAPPKAKPAAKRSAGPSTQPSQK